MRIWLDDMRPAPEGWVSTHWPDEVIAHLETGEVVAVSLDHDLGDDERGTGDDVIKWIMEAVVIRGFTPPEVRVHSANPSARQRMESGIQAIKRLAARNAHPEGSGGNS